MISLSHKEMVSHIRNRIKAAGIRARVRGQVCCGKKSVQVNAIAYGVEFPDDDQKTIRLIAKCNGLTLVRGMEINIDQNTNPQEFSFYMPIMEQSK